MRYSEYDIMGLAILKEMESFRNKIESGEIHAGCNDWIIRMCEATVASYTQFKDRQSWTDQIK